MQMTHRIITIITALLLTITHISIAQVRTLPPFERVKGAIARLGKGELKRVQYSPDGTQLAVGSSIGTWIYDTTTWQPSHLLTIRDRGVSHFAYHPEKNIIVTNDSDGTLNLWDTETGKMERELSSAATTRSVVFNPNGNTLAIVVYALRIGVLDTEKKEDARYFSKPSGHANHINCLAFNPNGYMLAAGEESGKIALWDTVNRKHILDLGKKRSAVTSAVFNNDGSILATVNKSDSAVRLWDMNTIQQIQTLKPKENARRINHIAYSADGGLLAAACINGAIHLWDVNTYQHIKTLTHKGVRSVSFSPDLRTLASSGSDGTVRVWNIFTGENTQTIEGFYGKYLCFAVSPDGKTIACQGNNKTIYLFDAATGALQKTVSRPEHRTAIKLAYSPDGKTFAAADTDDTISLFDADTGKEKKRIETDIGKVKCVAFSPDGNTVVSGSADNNVRLWNANTGELKHTLKGHKDSVITIAFSPDGNTLASGSMDKTVRLWDVNTVEIKTEIRKHGARISDLAFSPDSKTLTSVAYNQNIYLWDVATGKRNLVLKKTPSKTLSVVFSPDSKFLAFGSTIYGVLIYDVRAKKIVHNYTVSYLWVERVAFASGGNTLVSRAHGMVYLWDVSTF